MCRKINSPTLSVGIQIGTTTMENSMKFSLKTKSTVVFPGSSTGKESAYNAGDYSLIPQSGRSPVEGIGYPLQYSWASFVGSDGKESTCNAGDLGSVSGLGRSPGGGHENPFQYSCLENPHGQRSLLGCSLWGHRTGHNWMTKHTHRSTMWPSNPTLTYISGKETLIRNGTGTPM